MDIILLLDIVVILALQLLATTVYLRNKRVTLNRTFFVCVTFISAWIISNYFGNDIRLQVHDALLANRLIFVFSTFAVLFLFKFAVDLTGDKLFTRFFPILRFFAIVVAALSTTPLLVRGVHPQNGIYAITFGPLTFVYGGVLFGYLGLTLYVLWQGQRKSEGDLKHRIHLFLVTLLVCVPLLLLLQFILPTITGIFALSNVGILSILVPIYGLYYAVAKHKLFDLRLVIVRSAAYILSLGIITTAYSFTAYYATSLLSSRHNQALQILVNVGLVLGLVLTYQPLKDWFKRVTYKIFYQDAYEPQKLYAELNKILVSTIEIDQLLRRTSRLVQQTFNVEFCNIILNPTGKIHHRGGTNVRLMDSNDCLNELVKYWPKNKISVTDNLVHTQLNFKKMLNDNNISVVVKLTIHSKNQEVDLGLMTLGIRKNGYAYNNLDVQAIGNVSDEIAVAVQNAMHFEEIQQFNVTLQKRVEEQTRKYRAANERLKKLDETKDEFISMASHQLRTPLTSIKGYLSMVLEGDVGPLKPQQAELLKQSFMSSQRMVNLIADLLNLSRLNTGRFVIDASPTDLRVVVDQEIAQLHETASAKNITLRYTMPKTFSMVLLDEGKIHQVVMNFMDNAIYYTPEGGTVEVSLTETPTAVEYRVKDTGIGVPRELQKHLFTKFYRADNARRMRPDGTGLGLYMAKKVVVAQGGSIIFESQEGKGSTFGFRFSKKQAPLATSATTR